MRTAKLVTIAVLATAAAIASFSEGWPVVAAVAAALAIPVVYLAGPGEGE